MRAKRVKNEARYAALLLVELLRDNTRYRRAVDRKKRRMRAS
jgi:hypothetical protein